MLSNKVIIITGGAGLLGQEFVKMVIEQNGIAIMADINEKIGNQAKDLLSIEMSSKNIDFVQLDITSKESINRAIDY